MKKELHPGVIVAVVVVVLGIAVAAIMMTGNQGSEKVDLKKMDPASLQDNEPIKRGQPGYKERTTDPD